MTSSGFTTTLPHDHHNHRQAKEAVIEQMPSTEKLHTAADAFKNLGDPSRLQILWLLCHCEECVTNIAAIVEMSAPAVSHHLRLLKSAGLITASRSGREMYYKAADTPLVDSFHHMIEEVIRISCPDRSL